MAHDKLVVLDSGLPQTPGWALLSEAKRSWLQEKTSNIKKFGAMEGLAAASSAVELYEVREGLKGEKMGITDYINTVFSHSPNTAFTRLRQLDDLIKNKWSMDVIKIIAEKGALLLPGSAGIGLGRLISVSRQLPAPKESDDKTIEAFIENKVRPKLKEMRAAHRTGKVVRVSVDEARRLAFNDGRRTFRSIRGWDSMTSRDKKAEIATVAGWWMEDFGIPGELTVKRVSIPEGTVAKVGRPRLKGKTQ